MPPLPHRSLGGPPNAVIVKRLARHGGLADAVATTPAHELLNDSVIPEWVHSDRLAPLAKYGIKPPRQLLFYGPPGNGKTMTAQWLARKIARPGVVDMLFVRIQCDQLVGSLLGDTARNVSTVLDWIEREARGAVVLCDEVDTIFPGRQHQTGTSTGREITSAQATFWQRLDDWDSDNLFILATNRRDDLDPALLSRIGQQIFFGPPTLEQSEEVVNYWAELLHDHGGDVWGHSLRAWLNNQGHQAIESFRDLTQRIHQLAREHVLFFSDDPTP